MARGYPPNNGKFIYFKTEEHELLHRIFQFDLTYIIVISKVYNIGLQRYWD